MAETVRIALIGPLPPPSGGMANQTRQLSELLRGEGLSVEGVQTNAPYRPHWIGGIRGLRALFRLLPYLWRVWRAAGRVELLHIMANSGWSWHLFAAPAIWIGRLRGKAVLVNYRGGEAASFLERSPFIISISLHLAHLLVVPSLFLQQVFAKHGYTGRIVPNIIDLERFSPRPAAADNSKPHIIVARNLEIIYDNATALRAFAIVRRTLPGARRLWVAGCNPRRSEARGPGRGRGRRASLLLA